MALRFNIPRKLADVEREREGELCVPVPPELEPEVACDGCIDGLEGGPLNIVRQQATFDETYVTVRGLEHLDAGRVANLVSNMCKNLRALATDGLDELGVHGYEKGHPYVVEHLSAVHAYAFFLSCITQHCQAQAVEARKVEASEKGAAPKKRGGKAKAGAEDSANSPEWPAVMGRIVKALGLVLQADLDGVLYRVPADKFRLLDLDVQAAARCLQDPTIVKADAAAAFTACQQVLVAVATKHANCAGAVDIVAAALAELWRGHDHGPDVAVVMAESAMTAHGPQLGKALVNRFSDVPPEEYDDTAKREVHPVRRSAELLSSMAEKVPEVIHAALPQLMAYFGCQAETIRKHLVVSLGFLLKHYMGRVVSEKGSLPLQTSKTTVIAMIISRVNDKASAVRKAALNTIEAHVVLKDGETFPTWPFEEMRTAAAAALARLDDSSVGVGAALSLLKELVQNMVRTPVLTDTFLLSSIKTQEEQLKGMQPDMVNEDGESAAAPRWEDGALGGDDAAAAADGGDIPVPATQGDIIMPTQLEADVPGAQQPDGKSYSDATYSQLRLRVAILKEHLELSRMLAAALPEVETLLSSESADVAEKAITLLTLLRARKLQGVEDSWRRVWHSVFSPAEKVRETVLDAFNTIVLPEKGSKGDQNEAARNHHMVHKLVGMVGGLDQRDMQALDELMRLAVSPGRAGQEAVLGPGVVRLALRELRSTVDKAALLAPDGSEEAADVRHLARQRSLLCSMLVRHAPQAALPEAEHLVKMICTAHLVINDAVLVRDLATALSGLAAAPHRTLHSRPASALLIPVALHHLQSVLVSGHLAERGGSWPAAAQAAVAAIYKLHPKPHEFLMPLLKHMAEQVLAGGGRCSAAQLARNIFIVGCVATQQLALVDSLAKRIRRERNDLDKAAAAAGKAGEEDVGAQLGTDQAKDGALEILQEELEASILGPGSLMSCWGGIVRGLCKSPPLMSADGELAAAALSTLGKLMMLNSEYCDEENCKVFFTRLTSHGCVLLPSTVRCGMLVALADLYRRYPNNVEQFTPYLFECLKCKDGDKEVARTCLRILAHLILSDMTKPKGHMAHVARCLVAQDEELQDLAVRLFNSLAAKEAKGGKNAVDQYLLEIVSATTRGEPMADQDFRIMMKRLFGYIKEKGADAYKIRLVERFENVVIAARGSDASASTSAPAADADAAASATFAAAAGIGAGGDGGGADGCDPAVREWRGLSICLRELPYSAKGLQAIMERLRHYKHALVDERVYNDFKALAEHGRRGNRDAVLKQAVVEYEAKLDEAHNMLREEWLQQAAAAARTAAEAEVAAQQAAEAEVAEQQAAVVEAGEQEERSQQAAEDEEMEEDALEDEEGGVPSEEEEDVAPAEVDAAEGKEAEHEEEQGEEEYASSDDDEQEEEEEAYADCEGGNEEEEDTAGPADMDMDWEEDRTAASTPLTRRAGSRHAAAAATPDAAAVQGTPMAITPAPGDGGGNDSMAWSPAPTIAVALAAQQQENVAPGAVPFSGFHVKPDPDAAATTAAAVPFGGFRVKPDPDAAAQQALGPVAARVAAYGGGQVLGVRIKPDPEGRAR